LLFFFIENLITTEPCNKQSTTSSYISDDYKVLYIETVIEVDKPVFYERTTDTLSTINSEYHHHIPHHTRNTQRSSSTSNKNKYLMDITSNNNNNHAEDSTDDDDSSNQNNKPVNSLTTTTHGRFNEDQLKQQGDSGVELEPASSSSTICNQQTNINQTLFPPVNNDFTETSEPTLLRHVKNQIEFDNENLIRNQNSLSPTLINLHPSNTYWNHLKQNWFRSLLTGLLILLILFIIYFSGLDTCSRSTIIQSVSRKIIWIENEGIPTI